MESKNVILKLYRDLLREAHKYPQYNFRNYAIRKIKDRFREMNVIDKEINNEECIRESKESLDQLKRMRKIAALYVQDELVIEKMEKQSKSATKNADLTTPTTTDNNNRNQKNKKDLNHDNKINKIKNDNDKNN